MEMFSDLNAKTTYLQFRLQSKIIFVLANKQTISFTYFHFHLHKTISISRTSSINHNKSSNLTFIIRKIPFALGPSVFILIWRTLSQFNTFVEIEFMDVVRIDRNFETPWKFIYSGISVSSQRRRDQKSKAFRAKCSTQNGQVSIESNERAEIIVSEWRC
jgi:hypothetical protein